MPVYRFADNGTLYCLYHEGNRWHHDEIVKTRGGKAFTKGGTSYAPHISYSEALALMEQQITSANKRYARQTEGEQSC